MANRYRFCPIVLLTVATLDASAAESLPLQFRIDPTLCVLEREQSDCPVPLKVSWQAPELTEPLCLYHATRRKPIYCQYEAGQVALELTEPLRDSTRFELRGQGGRVLAAIEVMLARPVAELRPRRRHGWGMF